MNELVSRFEYQLRYKERTQVTLGDMEAVLEGLRKSLVDVIKLLEAELNEHE